ncbi:50S ribosomal protein L15 [Candidatus Babeliales bacterium]|nr:50S ribosomal protein L15 [Candidatus Babeliales bacterium]
MLKLNQLTSLTKKRKRVGRGGSKGGTSGKGSKGQLARTGGRSEVRPFFEGGQMPLSRRLPRRGFTNGAFKKEYTIINVGDLENQFDAGATIDKNVLRKNGFFKSKNEGLVKFLGNGTLTKNFVVIGDAFSKSAVQAIEKANGKAQLIKEQTGDRTTS